MTSTADEVKESDRVEVKIGSLNSEMYNGEKCKVSDPVHLIYSVVNSVEDLSRNCTESGRVDLIVVSRFASLCQGQCREIWGITLRGADSHFTEFSRGQS